ncbi:MAG: hypothetical protein J7K68_06420 [Candidatus Diapherotrites archaeon]|nr:hypothetical protein [Candidatus Diapherotrites archaeon]
MVFKKKAEPFKEIPESLKEKRIPEPFATFIQVDKYIRSGNEYHVFTTKHGLRREGIGFIKDMALRDYEEARGPIVAKFPTSDTIKESLDIGKTMKKAKHFMEVGSVILTSIPVYTPFIDKKHGAIVTETYEGPYDLSRIEFDEDAIRRGDFEEIIKKQLDAIIDVASKKGYVIDGKQTNFVVREADVYLREKLQKTLEDLEGETEKIDFKYLPDYVQNEYKTRINTLRTFLDNISRSGRKYDVVYIDRGIIVPGEHINKEQVPFFTAGMIATQLDHARIKEKKVTGEEHVYEKLKEYVKRRIYDEYPQSTAKEIINEMESLLNRYKELEKAGINLHEEKWKIKDLKKGEAKVSSTTLKPVEPPPDIKVPLYVVGRPSLLDKIFGKIDKLGLVHKIKDVAITGEYLASTDKHTVHKTIDGVVIKHPREPTLEIEKRMKVDETLSKHIPISRIIDFVFVGGGLITREEYKGEDLWRKIFTEEEIKQGKLRQHVGRAIDHMLTAFGKTGWVLDGDLSNFTVEEKEKPEVYYVSKSIYSPKKEEAADVLAREIAKLISHSAEKEGIVTGRENINAFFDVARKKILERAPQKGEYIVSLVKRHLKTEELK